MKVAVTGISGYLGGLIAGGLDADCDVECILGLDVVAPGIESDKFIYRRADVRTADYEHLLKGFDVVYHLASIVEPPKNLTMKDVEDINVEGSKRVIEGAARVGVPKIIYAGSIASYGAHPDNPEIITEEWPLRPNGDWYYSRTKGKVEFFLDGFQKLNPEIILIRFRPSIFLGPCVNNSIGRQVAAPVLIAFGRNVAMDLCGDEDVTDAFLIALRYGESDIFNLSGDGSLTVEEMGRIAGRPVIHVNHELAVAAFQAAGALGLFPVGTLDWVKVAAFNSIHVSSEKAKNKLGWKPKRDAAGAYIDYLKRNRTGDGFFHKAKSLFGK
jgi:UDP-glucose 4-epimerase